MAERPDMFSSPLAKTPAEEQAEEPSPLTDFKSPDAKIGDLQYKLFETPPSKNLYESNESQIEEVLSAWAPLGENAYGFTVDTMVSTNFLQEHGADESRETRDQASPGEKRVVILCDDHGKMLTDTITVNKHITVNMVNAAEPGQGNYLGDNGAKEFVDLYAELKHVVPEEVVLEQLQRLGRKKKDEFLKSLKQKGQAHLVDAGFTRFPGWRILYDVMMMYDIEFTRDHAITYGLYVLDASPAAGGGRFSIENKVGGGRFSIGERPWGNEDGSKVTLSQMMQDLTDEGFTHITFINLTCADFDEDLSDRSARYLARKAKIMSQLYSTQVISISPDFKKLTGTMPMGDELRAMIKKKDADEEEKRKAVLHKMEIEANREDRQANKKIREARQAYLIELSEGLSEMNTQFLEGLEGAAVEEATRKGASERETGEREPGKGASEGGRTRKKRYTKKQKQKRKQKQKTHKRSTRKYKKYRR